MKTFSVSELKEFEKCRQSHYFSYRMNYEARKVHIPFFIGLCFHSALEYYYGEGLVLEEAAKLAVEENLDVYKEKLYFEDIFNKDTEILTACETVYTMVDHYALWLRTQEDFDNPLADSNFEVLSAEHDFEAEVNGHTVRLRVDGLWRHKKTGEVFIHEYKTSKSITNFESGMHRDVQPVVYTQTISEHLDMPIAGIIYTLAKTKIPTVNKLKNGNFSVAQTQDTSPEWFIKVATEELGDAELVDANYAKYIYELRLNKAFSFFDRFVVNVQQENVTAFWRTHQKAIEEMNSDYKVYPVDNEFICSSCLFKSCCDMRLQNPENPSADIDHLEKFFAPKEK